MQVHFRNYRWIETIHRAFVIFALFSGIVVLVVDVVALVDQLVFHSGIEQKINFLTALKSLHQFLVQRDRLCGEVVTAGGISAGFCVCQISGSA